ncbi:DnaB-like helicase C-terminal domain-containing protein [Peptacetobacter hiranonis]|uniref:DnaB-like helicase C-terminal domain-containing protein n=1 Tax=Peptacetobacter hiranonis TaxID=89152 RepID=UPI0022E6F0CB|nr:DnaB-like helicase C-terminal domain-containing protein [Peptacetobacter hiranonis]
MEDIKASENLINKVAEYSVLGTLLIEPETRQALDIIQADFFTGVEKTVIESFKKLHEKTELDEKITLVELMEELKREKKEIEVSTISRYSDYAVTSYQQNKFIKILEDLYIKRLYYDYLKKALERAAEPSEVDEQIFDLVNKLESLKSNKNNPNTDELSNIIAQIFVEQKENNENLLKFGYDLLDDNIGGLMPGDYTIIGAKSGVGKSTLAMNIAYKVLEQGGKVLYVNLEMGKNKLVQRFITMLSDTLTMKKFTKKEIVKNQIDSMELVRVAEILNEYNNNLIIDNDSIRISEIIKIVRNINPDLVVIDYLQLLHSEPGQGGENAEQRLSNVTRNIRKMTLKYNCHVLALVQLNDSQRGQIPHGENVIRQSASVYQDATNVIYLHDPLKDRTDINDRKEIAKIKNEFKRIYNGKIDDENILKIINNRMSGGVKKYGLILDKVRDGMPGIAPVNFVGEHYRILQVKKAK